MSSLSAPSGGTLGEFGTTSVLVDEISSHAFSIPLSDKSSPSMAIVLPILLRASRFNSRNETSVESPLQLCSTVIFAVSFKSFGLGLRANERKLDQINLVSTSHQSIEQNASLRQHANSRFTDPFTTVSSTNFPKHGDKFIHFMDFYFPIFCCLDFPSPLCRSSIDVCVEATEVSFIMSCKANFY